MFKPHGCPQVAVLAPRHDERGPPGSLLIQGHLEVSLEHVLGCHALVTEIPISIPRQMRVQLILYATYY